MQDMDNIKLDQGYGFGIGAFETILYTDRLVFLKEHLERLNESLSQLHIDKQISEEEVLQEVEIRDLHYSAIKLMVSDKNTVIVDRPIVYTKEDYEKGMGLMLSPIRRNTTSPFTYMKTFNYGDSLLARLMAKERGYRECIMLNEFDQVAEGSMSNLFFIKDKKLYTPHEDSGLLKGIMRNWIVDHYPVEEGIYTLDDFRAADSIFMTNSLMGIMPVTFFEKPYFISAKLRQLMNDYWELLGGNHWIK